MENARKFIPVIIGGVVAIVVFFLSRKMRQSNATDSERASILEKAREAKLAKSILKNSEDDSQNTTR